MDQTCEDMTLMNTLQNETLTDYPGKKQLNNQLNFESDGSGDSGQATLLGKHNIKLQDRCPHGTVMGKEMGGDG